MNSHDKWLVVDLDQTLIKTDLFIEGLLRCLLTNPFLFIRWIFNNKPNCRSLKGVIADRFKVDYSKLPYRLEVLDIIRSKKLSGYRIVLATGAYQKYADGVAAYLGLFDHVISSDETINNTGEQKLRSLRGITNQSEFEYIGDCGKDFPILEASKKGYLVSPSKSFRARFQERFPSFDVVDIQLRNIWDYDSKLLRPHQWAKNIVFFLPAVTGFGFYDLNLLWLVLPTFSVMSLLASVVYILNDIADVESDRGHSDKKKRCFASGDVPVQLGFIMALILFGIAFIALLCWQPPTWPLFAFYFALTIAYTMVLKEIAILDIFVLISFYVIRIFIGIKTLEVPNSVWLMSFCILLFANLAFLKRYIEVCQQKKPGNGRRKYDSDDKEFLRTSGIATIFASIILMILYAKSEDFSEFYSNTDLFSLIAVPYGFMMLRMWYLASRNKVDSDPLVYTIKSPLSYLALIASSVILFCSR